MIDEKIETVDELLSWTPVKSDDDVKRLIYAAALDFRGNVDDLFMAAGCLFLGRVFGWRILRIAFSASDYARYQRVLSAGVDGSGGFKFADWMREEEPLARKSLVLALIKGLGRFWDAVKGRCPDFPISRRREVG